MTLMETTKPVLCSTDLAYFDEMVPRTHALELAKRHGRSVNMATAVTLPHSFAGHRTVVTERMKSDERFAGMTESFDEFALQALAKSFTSVEVLGAKKMEHDPTTMTKEVGAIYDRMIEDAEGVTYEAVILSDEGRMTLSVLRDRFKIAPDDKDGDGLIMGLASEYFAHTMLHALAQPPAWVA